MATAVWDPLWGSTPIITFTLSSLIATRGTAVGTPDYGSVVLGPLSSHTPARRRGAKQLVRKPVGQPTAGTSRASPPGHLRRYGSTATPRWILNQACLKPLVLSRQSPRSGGHCAVEVGGSWPSSWLLGALRRAGVKVERPERSEDERS